MNKNILYLAGLLNENEFDRTVDLPQYGNDLAGMAQRYAFNFGALKSTTILVNRILETAIRQLDNPEWNREEDATIMLKHLEEAVRKALKEIETSQKNMHPEL